MLFIKCLWWLRFCFGPICESRKNVRSVPTNGNLSLSLQCGFAAVPADSRHVSIKQVCMVKRIPKQYLPALSVIIAIVMSVLDGTIVNVALPSLTKEFGIEPDMSIWIVNAYQLVIVMFLLVFAAIGDIVGYKKVFLSGVFLFTLASLLCVVSVNFPMLVLSRIVQGVGAACIMSVNIALIRLIYPPQILGRGMSLNAMAVAVSSAAGPTIAGFILSKLTWHWLFAINIPLGIVAFAVGYYLLPENPYVSKRRVDIWSCFGNALTFGLMVYSLEGIVNHESRWLIFASFAAFFVVGYIYLHRQLQAVRHDRTPLLPVDLLKIPIFSLSILTSICSFTAQMLAMVALPFFLQDTLNFSPVETGLVITPWPLATLVAAPVAGLLVEHYHPGILGAIGMLMFSAGLLLLFFIPEGAGFVDIAWRIMLCGVGFGLFQTPNNLTIISSAPVARSGGASGMLGTARLVGQTVGTTGVAIVFSVMPHLAGSRLCLMIGAVIAFIAGLSSFSRLSQQFVNPRNRT